MSKSSKRSIKVAIVGAGPGGLCMAIQLKKAGFENFVILEKSAGVGGTWRHNRYPGCACDIPAPLYCFSFELNPAWSGPYPPQPEILAYLEHCAEKYGLLPHCRFGDGVRRAVWRDDAARWSLETESGQTIEAEVVVSAVGMFNELNRPEIEGLDDFEGTCFHSAHWDTEHDLSGETIGVIGSAASAVQFVPEIVKQAAQVHLFQRTANWVLPKEDTPFGEEQLAYFRTDPDAPQNARTEIFNAIDSGGPGSFAAIRADMETACLSNIDLVEDPELRAKLVPDHPWGCKRPLLSNNYYPTFNRPNLELVTEGIERVTPSSIVTSDGSERSVDTLILATGFQTTRFLSVIEVVGRGGTRLEDAWSDGAQAYKGVMTTGFPNLFLLYGPNTNSDSLITMIEFEVDHVVRQVQRLVDDNLAWIDVRPGPMAEYNKQLQQDIEKIEPWQAGCTDYYRAPSGRVVTQWPHRMTDLKHVLESPDKDAYETAPA
jgi:cation diffusion facilitator CzcD-associated flavoprotein CzcO